MIETNNQKFIRSFVNPEKWPISADEKDKQNVPDSLLPASASSVEVLPNSNANNTKTEEEPVPEVQIVNYAV